MCASIAAAVPSGQGAGPAAAAAIATTAAAVAAVASSAVPAGMPVGDVCATDPCLITDGGSCATSPNYPNDYPNLEGCTIHNLPPVALDVIAFDVEGDPYSYYDGDGDGDPTNDCPFDYLVVNGVKYCGTSGPAGARAGVVPSDGTMTWVSDSGVTESG